MAPRKSSSSSSSSRKGSASEAVYRDTRGGSFDAARARLPPNINWEKLSPEKQKNCERAFTAASRRSDRDIDARYQSALTASDMHFLRTGKYLRVTREMVINEEMYEEEDSHPRLWTSNLRQDSDPRMAALNQQYQNIDLQFQAAFPGFTNRGMAMSPTTMNTMPFSHSATGTHYDGTLYPGVQAGYAPQSYYSSSDESSPPPMTDSAGASPMVGIATPSPQHIGRVVPGNGSPATMCLPDNVVYSNTKYDPSFGAPFVDDTGYHQDAMYDGMADNHTMWGAGVSDEFSEFVNY